MRRSELEQRDEDNYARFRRPANSLRRDRQRTREDLVATTDVVDVEGGRSSSEKMSAWFRDRLRGLTPADFVPVDASALDPDADRSRVMFYVAPEVDIPEEFRDVTRHISSKLYDGFTEDEIALLKETFTVVLFVNFDKESEVVSALQFNYNISALGEGAPPVVALSHTARSNREEVTEEDLTFLNDFSDCGIDGIILGEPEGFHLAAEIQSTMMSSLHWHKAMIRSIDQNAALQNRFALMQVSLHNALWQYFRSRKYIDIPCLDDDLPECEPGVEFDGFKVGQRLAEGNTGKVMLLTSLDGDRNTPRQVMKVMDKGMYASVCGVQMVCHEIKLMRKISTPELKHPNIIQLYDVYHLRHQVLYRMEHGGSCNLFKYIMAQQKAKKMRLEHVRTITRGCLAGLCHLHLRGEVVHRDIKCENITVSLSNNRGLCPKICDFDLARRFAPDSKSWFYGGTFPFMAPEMIVASEDDTAGYFPCPADIWSMGLVILELSTTCNLFMKILNLPDIPRFDADRMRHEKAQLRLIHSLLSNPSSVMSILNHHCSPHVRGIADLPEGEVAEAMLKVSPEQRLTDTQIEEILNLNCDDEIRDDSSRSMSSSSSSREK